jgi:hypothetical protein
LPADTLKAVTDTISEGEASIIARERLRILTIGFYVRGGIFLAFGCFFLIYVAMFAGMSFIPESASNQPSPAQRFAESLRFGYASSARGESRSASRDSFPGDGWRVLRSCARSVDVRCSNRVRRQVHSEASS